MPNLFLQLQKADLAKRQVWGFAAVEQPDRAIPPEIMDYEKSKPHFQQWSDTIQKASQGKSLGNVRAMHGGQMLAVGRVIHLEPQDAQKGIYIGVEVVDDAAWEKVQKGVYTGFSIGGKYGAKWPDEMVKGAIRYEAIPSEVSLVDVPCMPDATYSVIKADGATTLRKVGMPMEEEEKEPAAEDAAETPESESAEGETTPPASEGETSASETQSTEEQPESAPSGAEGPEAPQAASLDVEAVKEVVISLMMDLGLVQPAGAQPMSMAMRMDDLRKASDQLSVSSEQLQKTVNGQQSAVAELQKTLSGQQSAIEELRKAYATDVAQIVAAVDALEKRGGQGPVIRDLGAISPQAMAEMQKASVLKEMLKDANDPQTRQALQAEITRLEIKAVQTQK